LQLTAVYVQPIADSMSDANSLRESACSSVSFLPSCASTLFSNEPNCPQAAESLFVLSSASFSIAESRFERRAFAVRHIF